MIFPEMLAQLVGKKINVTLYGCICWEARPIIIKEIIDLLSEAMGCTLLCKGVVQTPLIC